MALINALSELEESDEEPWCDLIFEVAGHERVGAADGESAWVFGRAVADLNGETIGFGFRVPLGKWSESGGVISFWLGQVWLESIGPETDRLIQCYADWFDLKTMSSPAGPAMRCTAVALQDGAPSPLSEKCSFKLFFNADEEAGSSGGDSEEADPYAELYFNVDLPQKRAWLREKDPEYRAPLMRFLTGALRTKQGLQ